MHTWVLSVRWHGAPMAVGLLLADKLPPSKFGIPPPAQSLEPSLRTPIALNGVPMAIDWLAGATTGWLASSREVMELVPFGSPTKVTCCQLRGIQMGSSLLPPAGQIGPSRF